MKKTQITPNNVTFKGLKVGFGHDGQGLSGTMYFGKTKVASFYCDGWSGFLDDVTVYDKDLELAILEYQKDVDTDVEFKLEFFIYDAIGIFNFKKQMQDDVRKSIKSYCKTYPQLDKSAVSCIVFATKNNYQMLTYEDKTKTYSKALPTLVTLAKSKYKDNLHFKDADDVYFTTYISERKLAFEKIK